MIRFELKIELLSDMCCGSGEGDGIYQDMSSSYDERGLPVIYGKRLKGLIRDRAEFLVEYDKTKKYLIDNIFGTGENAGLLRVGNAELENAKEIKRELRSLAGSQAELVTPKAVESIYTVQRYSTAIDEKGIARDHSLRMIGAVPKGEVFYAELELRAEEKSEEHKLIENACKILRRIGLNRTRGFGEVRCTLSLKEGSDPEKGEDKSEESVKGASLAYAIELDADVISPGDYIAGSAVQGMFINELLACGKVEENKIHDYVLGIRFSNAYLSYGEERCLPLPKGMRTVKNDSSKIYSMADGFTPEENTQYMRTSGYYTVNKKENEEELIALTPADRMEYHYAKKTHDLFMLTSLRRSQVFRGRIEADDAEKLKVLEGLIRDKKGSIVIGASSNAQYAAAKFTFGEVDTGSSDSKFSCKVIVNLVSDTVLVDEYGVNRSDRSLLEEEVKALFGDKAEVKEVYTDTETVGGYHSKWKLPKRRYTAFAKGTQVVVKLNGNSPSKTKGFMGILQTEGCGEYEIRPIGKTEYKLKKVVNAKTEEGGSLENLAEETKKIITEVLVRKALDEFRTLGEHGARSYCKGTAGLSSSSAMRFLTAYKAVERKADFETELKAYIANNFAGDSNKEIRGFSNNAVKKFDEYFKEQEVKEGSKVANSERRIEFILKDLKGLGRLNGEKERMLRVFMQGYIEAAKLYYREKHNKKKNEEGRE